MTPLKVLCDIIQTYMGLDTDQVYTYNSKINVPKDDRLYVAIGILNVKPFSNIRRTASTAGGFEENIAGNFMGTFSVNIMSRNFDARDRKEELILALNSQYSQQVQERWAMQIARIPSQFVNLSELEASAIPYRFNISVSIQYQYEKTKQVDYWTTFTKTVETEG